MMDFVFGVAGVLLFMAAVRIYAQWVESMATRWRLADWRRGAQAGLVAPWLRRSK